MLSKKWLINICLAAAAVFFSAETYDAWNREVKLPEDLSGRETISAPAALTVANKQPLAASNYDILAEKNLFASERKEIIPTESEPDKAQLTKADRRKIDRLNLLGVVVSKDRRTALVEAPKKRKDSGGARWVAEGDEIEGMRVVEIQEESILLSVENENVEVLLYDPERPRKRGTVKKDDQPTVMSTGDTSPTDQSAAMVQAAKKQKTVTRKKTTQTPKKKALPPRVGRPVLRKKTES